jgi:small subunit ribosomal protein S4
MKRKHKNYSRPKRPFEKVRIEEEGKIKAEFGLKNKREIWKTDAKLRLMREKAKNLISANPEEQKALFKGLEKIGLKVKSIADVLSLDRKDLLKRRLQTMVVEKKLATTTKQARQFIVHKKILVNGSVVNIPSYIVPSELENKITLRDIKKVTKKAKKETPSEEIENEEETGDKEE